MIIEFQNQLTAYSFPESTEDTLVYLEKYWLQEQEYLSIWKEVQSTIFNLDLKFPEMIINSGFKLLPRQGGLLFEQEEFELLKECIKESKDNSLFIIEDYNELNPPHESGPLLRFKYPVDLTWNEINVGEGISYELFQRPVRNYFVFGDSGKWGKYVANDFDVPTEVYCFKKGLELFFKQRFDVADDEEDIELKELIPEYFK